MSNDLVAYSRAGDIFHYRWAARRCLHLIYPKSQLQKVVIEGSDEKNKAGEYVIDIAEYYNLSEKREGIDYYQLKHTTVQKDIPFTLSNLKTTFSGFAERFTQYQQTDISPNSIQPIISFNIITNRRISHNLKRKIAAIGKGNKVDEKFENTLLRYTNLSTDELSKFCKSIHFNDGEGDYNVQQDQLRIELAQIIAGSIEGRHIDGIVGLVQENVLPDSNGIIKKEDILNRFGVTSQIQLYPAPFLGEEMENIIERIQYNELKEKTLKSTKPVIIHATGGVGKSVFCHHFVNSLPEGSLGIVYDCFGAGSYRRRSSPRHSHRHGLVQIVNELASRGLCNPFIIQDHTLPEDIMRKFLIEINTAANALKMVIKSATLIILIDAADNAEMAAKEFNQPCFVHELLKEEIPEGCKLAVLCRTERIGLLAPPHYISEFTLEPFTENETLENLKNWFPNASDLDGTEFHRLTGGNPRVQANALNINYDSINQLLGDLGPTGTTVEKQIESQLDKSISTLRELFPSDFQNHVNSICIGLASLPPNIPLDVLSNAAKVSVEELKSFIADIGRPLWISDNTVQFRDEPTETWFRKTFCATKDDLINYIAVLEPLAKDSSYIAEILPQLYHQAEQYTKLIKIALSDNFLPDNNPIDARNVRVYRLQFAFKAALKSQQYKDAIKIAMRAGEEMSGNQRQIDLFKDNVDLLVSFQSELKVREIAFKQILKSSWKGSENIYTASLLCGLTESKGEARSYLRAGLDWLDIYFEELEPNKSQNKENKLEGQDIVELARIIISIDGVKNCVNFLSSFRPRESIFSFIENLVSGLIDHGKFDTIDELLQYSKKNPYIIVGITSELVKVGKFPKTESLEPSLTLLTTKRSRIKIPKYNWDNKFIPAIISFAEACLHNNLSSTKVLRVLRTYIPLRTSRAFCAVHFKEERNIFMRVLTIRSFIHNILKIDIKSIVPEDLIKDPESYKSKNEITKYEKIVHTYLPWYLLRLKTITDQVDDLILEAKEAMDQSKRSVAYGHIENKNLREMSAVQLDILAFYKGLESTISNFYDSFIKKNEYIWIHDRLRITRTAFRSNLLSKFKSELEKTAYHKIQVIEEIEPEELARRYITLSRAVLISSPNDAKVYFDNAINVISKFGDEIAYRWEAVVELTKRICSNEKSYDILAYRFIRCAEIVGTHASEKHWDRPEAIRMCTKLSAGVGISALSRWRDRDVGSFDWLLKSLLFELVESDQISPSIGWGLTKLHSSPLLLDILSLCLDKEQRTQTKQFLLDDAIHMMSVDGAHPEQWNQLHTIATSHSLKNAQLQKYDEFYKKQQERQVPETTEIKKTERPVSTKGIDWFIIFKDLNITSSKGISEAKKRFENETKQVHYSDRRGFWENAILKIDESDIIEFIDSILSADNIEFFDLSKVFEILPDEWKIKVSFQEKWPDWVKSIGIKYAGSLVGLEPRSFDYYIKELNIEKRLIPNLKSGIFKGLEDTYDLADANTFYGFSRLASEKINAEEAKELVDFSLSRIELHIDEEFGDGIWDDWLQVSDDIYHNLAGFLWSALGSPRTKIRWLAARSVCKLAEFGSSDILDALIDWMEHNKVDGFGSRKFPFYNLHARLYLLIALSKISVKHPQILKKHNAIFVKYAVSTPHILIQKTSSEIVSNLEKYFPGLYKRADITSVKSVGESKMAKKEVDYQYKVDSYWHKNNEVDPNITLYLDFDFERYWLESLGKVFGISSNQIRELVSNIIVKDWGIKPSEGHIEDPRMVLWNQTMDSRETWHDHGYYPKTDNYIFYLSYHAMHVVASNLIKKMPELSLINWGSNNWEDWISHHSLTRSDGKWLADFKDPLPLNRPKWIISTNSVTREDDIEEDDFMNYLKVEENGNTWINVEGGWVEKNNERHESFYVSSALVSKKTSQALLNALSTCSDPHDYKLPGHKEENMEINSDPFILRGWINDDYNNSKGLDRFDPYAREIDYPPYSIGEDIINKLSLSVKNYGKEWTTPISDQSSIVCSIWNSYVQSTEEEPVQSGKLLKATSPFLKHLCEILDCDIIFKVGITRELKYRHEKIKSAENESAYKIYILSSDGKLKNTERSYNLG